MLYMNMLVFLCLQIPVVASDTGLRPGGVVKFELGNVADFQEKLLSVLENVHECVYDVNDSAVMGNFQQLLAVYKQF